MLPFLKNKQQKASQTGVIVKQRGSDEVPEDDSNPGIEACAMELIIGMHTKDVKMVAKAIQSAFEILESQPHEESPHTYASQNIKATGDEY